MNYPVKDIEFTPMRTAEQLTWTPDMEEYWQLQVESAQRKLDYAVKQLGRFAVNKELE